MCGIIGIVKSKDSSFDNTKVRLLLNDLLKLSQSRGKDSSGIAVVKGKQILVYKKSLPASKLIKSTKYKEILNSLEDEVAIIGHARMETNGSFALSYNNQPVVKNDLLTIHNGIIVNDEELWKKHPRLKREFEVDTEVFNSLLRMYLNKGADVLQSLNSTLKQIEGSYAFATLFQDMDLLLLATNTGSLYSLEDRSSNFFIFASEYYFIKNIAKRHFRNQKSEVIVKQIKPGNGILLNTKSLNQSKFSIGEKNKIRKDFIIKNKRKIKFIGKQITVLPIDPIIKSNERNAKEIGDIIQNEYQANLTKIKNLKRCTKCLLPETMPFIKFDKKGICNYCRDYVKSTIYGKKALDIELKKFDLKKDGQPNCIVSFSGGRDSSYALHYVKKTLGLTPLAFSYDWGMLTDLGRRNQARMTGKLGVEHILLSADIQKKRNFIRKNVLAWLKRPRIGMVPLFMAGDKQYFFYLNKLNKETGIDLIIYADNLLEKTYFKYGYAGIELKPQAGVRKAYNIGEINSLKLLWYYAKEYLLNHKYINPSLLDTFTAYISSYGVPKDYLYLYRYIKWDEKTIENTLLNKYNWETADDTKNTWRIGDGTASFYNYIYYTVTGFTENDTFRSNQIREGQLSRAKAQEMAAIGNIPRVESILWYCNTIRIDAKKAIEKINRIPKLYE